MFSAETRDNYLDWLKAEIERAHNCPAYYVRTETVRENNGAIAGWSGEVEVFGLIGHPKAKHCFAWGHGAKQTDWKGEFAIVIDSIAGSPKEAVRMQLSLAALAASQHIPIKSQHLR
jgi:hypothetical protein